MTSTIVNALVTIAAMYFVSRRTLRYLQYFQQEEYNGARFVAWYRRYKAYDTRASIVVVIALILGVVLPEGVAYVASIAGALALVPLGLLERDPRKDGKLPLKLTARARRIWYVALGLAGVVLASVLAAWSALGWAPSAFWLLLLVQMQAVPFVLVLANTLLEPYEHRLQLGFIREAKAIVKRANPIIVGITGSYGKTSTKAILGNFLETIGPTFWPPKSINTQMGIVREIRERLAPGFRFAVIEMGAYGVGSISRLCSLTPPRVALITNIGVMHLERFGSREAVYQAKSELARALPPDGILICNADDQGARRVAEEFPAARTVLYGMTSSDADFRMTDVAASPLGSTFKIHWSDHVYEGGTKLLGRPQLSNLLGAFATACVLGVNPATILAVAAQLEAQAHRMALRREGDVVTIDDSYNSNPEGFGSALEVLKDMPGDRKILVTPGMVELGSLQESENRRLAKTAAGVCQLVVVVGDTNSSAITDGLKDGGMPDENIIHFKHRDQAVAYLQNQTRKGDVVLWENDLPDVYEAAPQF